MQTESMRQVTPGEFSRWLEEYSRASVEDDARASAALFSSDARYYESPHDEPIVGREAIQQYWKRGAQSFTNKTAAYEILAVQDNLGVARWQARFTVLKTGARASLDCIFLVEFDAQGKCSVFREWWHWRNLAPEPQTGSYV